VKKVLVPASIACLLTALIIVPTLKASSSKSLINPSAETISKTEIEEEKTMPESKAAAIEAASTALYDSLKLGALGLPKQVLSRDGILTICDFSQSSKKKRLYIIDTKNYRVLMNTYVAHGKNSGLDYAQRFSNTPESLQSSLGFYVTKGTYFGKHGLSLKLAGVERGYNDKAEDRAVVVHGADYIGSHRLSSPYMGRSFGCPAVPQEQSDKVINLLKNGTCLFIYHPTQQYLHGSKILNG
jgi:hypothetical protein